ncbi:helix-turn-helix domain-containing protein [Bacillus velezensis]|uniref:helix-turn-helix domain-containing protein n=1 Tax=Bacillus velezensis TaxID=492670 RepID=UPI000C9F4998|nr:helix-turn-helix domain-containing protein [Bacillus velezensis]AUS14886.1 helix-turn-helix domain-containing protein [Bacillus velezensis]URD63407.1 helix-turn-helix domain-containing protein [Bacillus velezensis]WED87189.1 helix-turn-helix domain-containing protein [Bacillus velezensis]WFB54634.1 helix-turn-helix domain-containing protein [Bacillus velezensis]
MHYLAEHQTFNSTAALNAAVYEHIKRNTYDLNDTDRQALKKIARYAVKFSGVAHLKAETLAELIGKSVKTARRALNKLATLGIVKKIATTRKINGGKGANIIVILPVDDQSTMTNRGQAEKPTETTAEAPKTENEPSDSIKRSKNQNNVLDTATVPAEALKGALPDEIYNAMSRYFDAEDIYKYYGILLRAKASVDRTIRLEEHAAPFVEAWHATIMKAKSHEIRRFEDYLYAGFRKAAWTVKARLNCGGSLMDRFRQAFETA